MQQQILQVSGWSLMASQVKKAIIVGRYAWNRKDYIILVEQLRYR